MAGSFQFGQQPAPAAFGFGGTQNPPLSFGQGGGTSSGDAAGGFKFGLGAVKAENLTFGGGSKAKPVNQPVAFGGGPRLGEGGALPAANGRNPSSLVRGAAGGAAPTLAGGLSGGGGGGGGDFGFFAPAGAAATAPAAGRGLTFGGRKAPMGGRGGRQGLGQKRAGQELATSAEETMSDLDVDGAGGDVAHAVGLQQPTANRGVTNGMASRLKSPPVPLGPAKGAPAFIGGRSRAVVSPPLAADAAAASKRAIRFQSNAYVGGASPSPERESGGGGDGGDDEMGLDGGGGLQFKEPFIGTCHDMCPESERTRREGTGELNYFERVNPEDRYRTSRDLCVRKNQRNFDFGDKSLSEINSEFRSPVGLRKTMDHLRSLMDRPDHVAVIHAFLWDRYRAVRKEIETQRLPEQAGHLAATIAWNEEIARWQMMADYELQEYGEPVLGETAGAEDVAYDAKLNQEQLVKVYLDLLKYYKMAAAVGLETPNSAEFKCYFILITYGGAIQMKKRPTHGRNPLGALEVLFQVTKDEQDSAWLLVTRALLHAMDVMDTVTLVRAARLAPYLLSTVLALYFTKLRSWAAKLAAAAYRGDDAAACARDVLLEGAEGELFAAPTANMAEPSTRKAMPFISDKAPQPRSACALQSEPLPADLINLLSGRGGGAAWTAPPPRPARRPLVPPQAAASGTSPAAAAAISRQRLSTPVASAQPPFTSSTTAAAVGAVNPFASSPGTGVPSASTSGLSAWNAGGGVSQPFASAGSAGAAAASGTPAAVVFGGGKRGNTGVPLAQNGGHGFAAGPATATTSFGAAAATAWPSTSAPASNTLAGPSHQWADGAQLAHTQAGLSTTSVAAVTVATSAFHAGTGPPGASSSWQPGSFEDAAGASWQTGIPPVQAASAVANGASMCQQQQSHHARHGGISPTSPHQLQQQQQQQQQPRHGSVAASSSAEKAALMAQLVAGREALQAAQQRARHEAELRRQAEESHQRMAAEVAEKDALLAQVGRQYEDVLRIESVRMADEALREQGSRIRRFSESARQRLVLAHWRDVTSLRRQREARRLESLSRTRAVAGRQTALPNVTTSPLAAGRDAGGTLRVNGRRSLEDASQGVAWGDRVAGAGARKRRAGSIDQAADAAAMHFAAASFQRYIPVTEVVAQALAESLEQSHVSPPTTSSFVPAGGGGTGLSSLSRQPLFWKLVLDTGIPAVAPSGSATQYGRDAAPVASSSGLSALHHSAASWLRSTLSCGRSTSYQPPSGRLLTQLTVQLPPSATGSSSSSRSAAEAPSRMAVLCVEEVSPQLLAESSPGSTTGGTPGGDRQDGTGRTCVSLAAACGFMLLVGASNRDACTAAWGRLYTLLQHCAPSVRLPVAVLVADDGSAALPTAAASTSSSSTSYAPHASHAADVLSIVKASFMAAVGAWPAAVRGRVASLTVQVLVPDSSPAGALLEALREVALMSPASPRLCKCDVDALVKCAVNSTVNAIGMGRVPPAGSSSSASDPSSSAAAAQLGRALADLSRAVWATAQSPDALHGYPPPELAGPAEKEPHDDPAAPLCWRDETLQRVTTTLSRLSQLASRQPRAAPAASADPAAAAAQWLQQCYAQWQYEQDMGLTAGGTAVRITTCWLQEELLVQWRQQWASCPAGVLPAAVRQTSVGPSSRSTLPPFLSLPASGARRDDHTPDGRPRPSDSHPFTRHQSGPSSYQQQSAGHQAGQSSYQQQAGHSMYQQQQQQAEPQVAQLSYQQQAPELFFSSPAPSHHHHLRNMTCDSLSEWGVADVDERDAPASPRSYYSPSPPPILEDEQPGASMAGLANGGGDGAQPAQRPAKVFRSATAESAGPSWHGVADEGMQQQGNGDGAARRSHVVDADHSMLDDHGRDNGCGQAGHGEEIGQADIFRRGHEALLRLRSLLPPGM